MRRQPKSTPSVLRDLGLRIGELRLERDLTQETASERLGMLTPNYARIEQGRQNLTVDTLVRVAVMLGVSVAELFEPPRRRHSRPGRPKKTKAQDPA